eukprot:4170026-Pleurochrysis_carterae.AAC.1
MHWQTASATRQDFTIIIDLATPPDSPAHPPSVSQNAPTAAALAPTAAAFAPTASQSPIENPPTIPPSDGQTDQVHPSPPEETEPEPSMPPDEAMEPEDTREFAPIRPKIFFGEPDPA